MQLGWSVDMERPQRLETVMNVFWTERKLDPLTSDLSSMTNSREAGGEAFDLPLYAGLTYQEYSHCSHGIPVEEWLCESFGMCGVNHV